jgi:hypothetical protein
MRHLDASAATIDFFQRCLYLSLVERKSCFEVFDWLGIIA